jgi:exonuclease VII small subunit
MLTVEQVTEMRNDIINHVAALENVKADDAKAQKQFDDAVNLIKDGLNKLEEVRNRLLEL